MKGHVEVTQEALENIQPGPRIHYVEEVGSTNDLAFQLAGANGGRDFWVQAGRQAAGRGQRGRRWISLEGNLHASFCTALRAPGEMLSQLALVAGLAVRDLVAELLSKTEPAPIEPARRPCIKWPNDVLVDGKKIGGVLIETRSITKTGDTGDVFRVVIGVGVNLAAAPQDLQQPSTSIAQLTGRPVSSEALGAAMEILARKQTAWLLRWRAGEQFEIIRRDWLDHCCAQGRIVRVRQGEKMVSGTLETLDSCGALVLRDRTGKLITISSGAVEIDEQAAGR